MLRKLVVPVAAAAVLGVAVLWFVSEPDVVPAGALGARHADLANGQTMFRVGGCVSCHAVPGQDDKSRLGGGLALKSPFGTFYAPNISPDPTDGIGAWTEAEFVTALTRGTSPDGRHYYPAFPYASYQRITIDDARDLFAFIKMLPPVRGRVRDHDVAFPFNIRRGVGVWKLLFLDGAPFRPDSTKSAAWNRGAYLVNGPGHCAECHSARNLLGGIVTALRFAGAPALDGKGWVPNITQRGLENWSEKDIAYLLETGQDREGDSVGSTMTEVVRNTEQLSPEDRTAIATYIKSLPPVEGPRRPGRT
ncbi:MAG: cytochrome c [Xanthobacteraceae bacterium]|jgi:mono/diheme cytochrome c family protein